MEKHPSIRRRDDEFLDGSTVQRATPLPSDLSPKREASVGSTASLNATSGFPSPGTSPFAEEIDEAATVIRKPDGESGVKTSPPGLGATPAAVASVLLGTHLNHFLLEEMIGGGGMGAVFRARDERLDRIVAIKVIPFVGDDVDLQRRFRNEAQNAARLDHPYIARVFDVGQFEQWHYIVFEHVEGINIRDMIARDGVLSIDDAVYYTRQIAEAIEHANGRGIVHRDIKPSNVLVGIDGNVKVVDMGLARSQQIEVSGDMTASGVTLGTFDYISPEQARDPRDADVRSDIYSLGCTLYYMLTGRPPYPGGTMLQKLLSHGNSPPPDPRGLRHEVSANLTAIIHKMLAKNPEDRYPRAIDVVADLRELALREGLVRAQSRGTLTIAPTDPVPQFLSRHLPWMIAAGLVLLIAAWLQLSSSVSQDRFALPSDAAATVLRQTELPAEAPPTGPSEATKSTNTSQRPLEAISSQTSAREPVSEPLFEPDVATKPPLFGKIAMQTPNASVAIRSQPTTSSTVPVERIVIGEESDDPTARVTQTLADAIRLAEELQVDQIEVAIKVLVSEPVKINRDGLTIRSTVGKSEIRFIDGDALSMQRIAMIDVGMNRLTLQDLHLSWNARNVGIEGGSMFRIASSNRLLHLSKCTLNIENLADREQVFAIEISDIEGRLSSARATAPSTGTNTSKTTASVQLSSKDGEANIEKLNGASLVAIEFENVAARGEMTLINLVDPIQLQFQWHNGLLAVSRRMLETTGTNSHAPLDGNEIRLSLDQVTIWASEGLVKTALGPSGLHPMRIDRNSRRTVFHHNPTASHMAFEGLESNAVDPGQLVQIRGEDNAYDFARNSQSPLLTLGQWNGLVLDFRLADILIPQKANWVLDRSPQWFVLWSKPMPTVPISRLSTTDFLQDGTLFAGFDMIQLPNFPDRVTIESEI